MSHLITVKIDCVCDEPNQKLLGCRHMVLRIRRTLDCDATQCKRPRLARRIQQIRLSIFPFPVSPQTRRAPSPLMPPACRSAATAAFGQTTWRISWPRRSSLNWMSGTTSLRMSSIWRRSTPGQSSSTAAVSRVYVLPTNALDDVVSSQ